jgi:hypothetical protein
MGDAAAAAAAAAAAHALRAAHEDGLVRHWADFEALEELGRGAFGVVVRVRRRRGANLPFACKTPFFGLPRPADGADGDGDGNDAGSADALRELREEFTHLRNLNTQWLALHEWERDWFPIVKVRARGRETETERESGRGRASLAPLPPSLRTLICRMGHGA